MTPANSDTPLRRSEVSRNNQSVAINDDDAERMEERRQSVLQNLSLHINETTTIEDNETLKKCLELFNGNKLSRENAWTLSLIDTLSSLLDRHHKSLNNFKMAGSSLEASSKVYGLRVDSIHIDVLRMASGLNAKKFSEKNLEDSDDDAVATAGEGNADPDASAAGVENNGATQKTPTKKKPKQRQRRAVCTITKNKETLNARLDTNPLQDPVFGKLNSTVGSINSSNRLMNNILLTTNSILRLRTNFPIFDGSALPECNYELDFDRESLSIENMSKEMVPCERLFRFLTRCKNWLLRPLHSGYIISDTPEDIPDEPEPVGSVASTDDFTDHHQSMAFDINAECEPIPEAQEYAAIVDVDYAEFDDLTTEERTAINRCKGMRKQPVLIEDLRPVDSTTQLEYSYRPLENISRFWAGPAHWKFKRSRASSFAQHANNEQGGGEKCGEKGSRNTGVTRQRSHAAAMLAKKRQMQLDFSEVHDDLFLKLDENFKRRRVNIQKKWDNRKLKLPTDLRLDTRMFFQYQFAAGLRVTIDPDAAPLNARNHNVDDDDVIDDGFADIHDNNMSMDAVAGLDVQDINCTQMSGEDMAREVLNNSNSLQNDTILEIPNVYENAPTMVQKIVVPFAKRAKVIDMKSLKKNCTTLIVKQLQCHVDIDAVSEHLEKAKNEQYVAGIASFQETLEQLPELLTHNMAESLSPAIAVYSVLHLANDLGLRLIQQEDLEDFKIRQIST